MSGEGQNIPLRALLVDDEAMARERLTLALADVPGVSIVGSARNGHEALDQARASNPDLIFLDIQMPGMNGLQVARALRESGDAEIVFVTAFSQFAVEAFELEATDYIMKPVRLDRLREAIGRARRRRANMPVPAEAGSDGEDALWVPHRDGLVKVSVSDIRRVQAARDYALIYTDTNTHILRTTMADLERRLNSDKIIRVHRSSLVRTDTIVRTELNGRKIARVHTDDGAVIEVSASHSPRLAEALLARGAA